MEFIRMYEISIKKAALVNAASKYLVILFGIIFNAILARIVTPNEFGVVAVMTVFTNFFGVFADMGIGTAVVQDKGLSEHDINHIFSFTLYIGMLLSIAFMGLSILISCFYKNNIYTPLGSMLCVSILFSAFNMVPNALLLKEKKFVSISIRTVLACITSSIIAIVLANSGWGCYALVMQSILNNGVIFAWNYMSTRLKFIPQIDFSSIDKIKRYSGFQFLFSCVNYFSRNLDNLLVSKYMGESILGYYDKAYKLTLYPTNNLTHVITPVLHPILSDHQTNQKYIYDKYIEILKLLSLMGIFIMPVCFFCRTEIILLIFGDQWVESISCFGYLALSIWAQMLASSSGSIFQSLGNTKLLFVQGIITSGLTVLCILFGVISGDILFLSKLVALAYNINFLIVFYILISKGFKYRFLLFLKHFYKDGIILLCMMAEGFAMKYFLNLDSMTVYARFVIKGILFLTLYCIFLRLFNQHKLLLKYLHRKK